MTVRTKWAGTGTATPRQPPNIVAQLPDQIQIIYVGKHGNDADDGLNIESAKLTIAAAIAAAVAQTPSTTNRFAIFVADGGTYTENLTVPEWVQLEARSATISGTLTLQNNSDARVHEIVNTFSNTVVKSDASGLARLDADIVRPGTLFGNGIVNSGVDSVLVCHVRSLVVGSARGVSDSATGDGGVFLFCDRLLITSNGIGIYRTGAGRTIGSVGDIFDGGAGTAISIAGGEADLVVDRIACLNAYAVAAVQKGDIQSAFIRTILQQDVINRMDLRLIDQGLQNNYILSFLNR